MNPALLLYLIKVRFANTLVREPDEMPNELLSLQLKAAYAVGDLLAALEQVTKEVPA